MIARFSTGLILSLWVFASSSVALADDMDVALSRLRLDTETAGVFRADNESWSRLMSQIGFALATPVLSPARTTGYRGFYIGFESQLVGIDRNADYWSRGTEGDEMTLTANRFVQSMLTASRLSVRKGLPFGFELGASLGHFYNTDTWAWGAELRLALIEGYREGFMAFLPDLAVRGAIRTLTGDSEFHLSVPSVDIIASKRFVLGGSAILTPILAAQFMWILADSELIDLTPERDAFAECSPVPDTPGIGQSPVRCEGSAQDLGNNAVYEDVRAFRARLAVGLQFQYRLLTLGVTFHFDVQPPHAGDALLDGQPRQWDLALAVGATY